MKTMFKTAIAAVALLGAPAAFAQHTTSTTTYSANPIPATPAHFDWSTFQWVPASPGKTSEQQFNEHTGSRFKSSSSAPDNVGTADASADANKQTFALTGSVNKDCSFYGGGTSSHTIALNTIGIRTQSSDNVSQAFNQAGDITANFNTATAGCNTKNTVSITTAHNGRLTNGSPGDYDNGQFTAEIPYGLTATWTGVGNTGTGQTPGTRTIQWTPGQSVPAPVTGGAWRSSFNMDIVAPAQTKGLVAGTYEDTITVTLAAS